MTGTDRPDALIFAGPKVMLDGSVPEEGRVVESDEPLQRLPPPRPVR